MKPINTLILLILLAISPLSLNAAAQKPDRQAEQSDKMNTDSESECSDNQDELDKQIAATKNDLKNILLYFTDAHMIHEAILSGHITGQQVEALLEAQYITNAQQVIAKKHTQLDNEN